MLGDWKFNLAVLMQTDIAVIREPLALYHHRIHAGDIYANTVVGSTAMHKEFNAVVRNQLIRGGGTLGMAMALGHMAQDQRDRLDTLTNRVKSLEKTVAMQSLALERLTGLDRTAEPNDSNARDKAWIIRHLRSRRKLPERLKIAWGFRRLGRSIPWPDLSAALAQYGFSIPTPPDFDEACYLAENADVANDVRQGKFGSGYDHYVKYGLVEGRRRPNH